MSNFKTLVNFSTQIKEFPNTDGTLSGSVNVQQYTILGTDYSELPLGLDNSTTGVTSTFFPTIYGTFTGTTGSTTFFFSDPNMDLGIPYLSALTPSNSGITQNVEVYIPLTTLIVDGNSFDIYYSGVSYDLVASNMYEYTPGEFSGITFTNVLEYISGTTYPWWFLKSGSTTWNEVKGRTQTDRLTVVEGANPGYVLTSSNSDGDAVWLPVSGGSFTGGTGSCITDLYVTNVHGCSPITIWDSIQSNNSQATGTTSFAFGYQTQALGDYSHAEGWGSVASGHGSHAEGGYPGIFAGGSAIGDGSHAEGVLTVASGAHSHSENYYTTASGNFSHAEGNTTIASGENSHSEGISTQASGYSSHAEGGGTMASGQYSHAEGTFTVASGFYSHSEGAYTVASGGTSHAEGTSTVAGGDFSHAEGNFTTASGPNSHSQGIYTIASGDGSHAGGYGDTLSKVIASQRGSFNHSVVDNTYSGTGSSNLGTFILGGFNHSVSTEWCGIIGGQNNIVRVGGIPVPVSSVIVGGNNNVINTGIRSVILGGNGLTGSTNDTVYVPDFVIKKVSAVPTGATDTIGEIGSITYDNDWLYVKTPRSGGLWGKVALNTSW